MTLTKEMSVVSIHCTIRLCCIKPIYSKMIRPSGSRWQSLRLFLIAIVATGAALTPIAIEPWLNSEKYRKC